MEQQYLSLLARIAEEPLRDNRTGIPSRSSFAEQLRVNLTNDEGVPIIPLLTTKKVSFANVYHELIWFLRGSKDTSYLRQNNVRIWDGNSSREFLDSRGLYKYNEGEVGPIYGSQWRDFNGAGIDQIKNVIHTIKHDPMSRRMLVSAWNPAQEKQMALPACVLGNTNIKIIRDEDRMTVHAKDVRLYDLIYDGEKYQKINEIFVTPYVGQLYFVNRTIVTPNHGFLVLNLEKEEFVAAKDLTTDHVLLGEHRALIPVSNVCPFTLNGYTFVYNFDVDDSHTYWSNGMISHNCHYAFQFYVTNDHKLSCIVNMRSADLALGVPYNLVSYALLTHMIANVCELSPGELVINMADCHIYANHDDQVKTQLLRTPKQFPTIDLPISRDIDDYIYNFAETDYKIIGYEPDAFIKYPMN